MENRFRGFIRSGRYILGETVEQFENELAQKTGFRYAIGCASGTDALIISLKALEIPAGSDVLTPAFSFIASCSAVAWAGFNPVLADVDKTTANVTVETLEAALTPNTRAVIVVDLYGRQAPITDINAFCKKHDLALIEDGAQSLGVPNLGADLYTTSFYPTKNLGTIGDAGAVMTDNETLASRLRPLVQHGALDRKDYSHLGTNARLDALHALMVQLKLPHLNTWTQNRRQHAHEYIEALSPLQDSGKFHLPLEKDTAHVWSLFTLRLPNSRNQVLEYLKSKQIGCGIYYDKALSEQPIFKSLGQRCPNAEALANEVLSIPLYPELTLTERQTVLSHLRQCLLNLT